MTENLEKQLKAGIESRIKKKKIPSKRENKFKVNEEKYV